jgi:cell wall-associated NlpC family hydrolase
VRIRVVVGLLLIVPLVGTASAQAANIAAQRREARQVQARLLASQRALEPVIQRYDLARLRLSDSKTRLFLATQELHSARHNLAAARVDLAHALRSQYMQPQPDATAILLGAGSLSQALDEIALYKRTRGYYGRTVAAIGTWKVTITKQHRIVLAQTARRSAAFRQLQATKGEIDRTIARNRRLLRGLQRSIRRELAAQRRAQRIADAAAARRAQAALASAGVHFSLSSLGGLNGSGSDVGIRAAQVALRYLGTPYHWGAEGPGGFDCSGLMQWAYAQAGIRIPRVTSQQIQAGTYVPRDRLAPGDLVFFDGGHHVGMYLGKGAFVQAPHTGDVVKVSSLASGYYSSEYFAGIRVYS